MIFGIRCLHEKSSEVPPLIVYLAIRVMEEGNPYRDICGLLRDQKPLNKPRPPMIFSKSKLEKRSETFEIRTIETRVHLDHGGDLIFFVQL
jgi:hypothetical protein